MNLKSAKTKPTEGYMGSDSNEEEQEWNVSVDSEGGVNKVRTYFNSSNIRSDPRFKTFTTCEKSVRLFAKAAKRGHKVHLSKKNSDNISKGSNSRNN